MYLFTVKGKADFLSFETSRFITVSLLFGEMLNNIEKVKHACLWLIFCAQLKIYRCEIVLLFNIVYLDQAIELA